MEFNVAQLLKAAVGDSRVHQISEDIGELDGSVTRAPVTGRVRIVRMPRTMLVEASLKTEVALNCSRCLEELVLPLTIEFVEEYEPTIDIETGLPVDSDGDQERFRIDQNHVLSIAEAVREYGLLAMPMQPICRSDCRGLCPECGQNRNLVECGCSGANLDSRLSGLQALLKDQ